jgi:glucan endo-1,3-alpha-glucosidase
MFGRSVLLAVVAAAVANAVPMFNHHNVTERATGNPKVVVAHFMVSNAAPYGVGNWKNDINLALANGIDGFALNVSPDPGYSNQVANAYASPSLIYVYGY